MGYKRAENKDIQERKLRAATYLQFEFQERRNRIE
jgi:hypothetical protein